MTNEYYIYKDDVRDSVHISMHPPSGDDRVDYFKSFVSIWTNGYSIDSPFKTLDEAEEFIITVMELLKE